MQFARQIYQLSAGTDLSEKTFDEGRVAFRPMLFSEYRSYEPYPWRIKRSSNFEWDCIAMPSGTRADGGNYSRLSTLMLGISQRTKHSRLSWELLKTIACTEEMQTMVYTELSGVSALHSVTESDEVARLLQLDSQDTASRSACHHGGYACHAPLCAVSSGDGESRPPDHRGHVGRQEL